MIHGAMASNLANWDNHSVHYSTNTSVKDMLEIPFLEAQIKSFAVKQDGASWKALDVGCGAGKYTIKLLQAGASLVLANDLSASMVEVAKKEIDKLFLSESVAGNAELHVISATNLSSIPGAQKGKFDVAICVYIFCNLASMEEIKQVLAEIFKMLKPGGKLMLYEAHVIEYMKMSKYKDAGCNMKPKEDGADWNYYEDEGKPREICMTTNSGVEIKFNNRWYTLSSWVSSIVEAGFQITQLLEPYLDPKTVPASAPDYIKCRAGNPLAMFWECTKPLSQ